MNQETQLKLQAYFDGELSVAEHQEVERLLQQDAGAKELFTELSYTAAALAGHEADIKLPESREFYWSKIQREISRVPKAAPAAGLSLVGWLRRVLIPAGAAAAVVIAVVLSLPHAGGMGDYASTTSSDAGTFTYHNYATGTTLVWLDYPAENNFSDADWDDTMDL